jgi:uncharacterized protein (DUF305 family)
MRQIFPFVAVPLGVALLCGLAVAQSMPHAQPAAARVEAPPPDTAAIAGYKAAMGKMHKDMDIAWSGNADRDFVAGMIPHHQGAIDMAEVVLQHGSDPQVRKLAQDIIAAQQREIAMLRDWLAAHPK